MLALKPVLQSAGFRQAKLARELNLSTALIAQLLNHDKWPTSPDKNSLIAAITETLAAQHIAVTAADFEPVPASLPAADTTPNQEGMDMLLRKQSLSPQAKRQFSIFKDPFENDLNDSEDVFITQDIRYVREHLWSTAKNGGFIAIVGESGAGKTTLRKDLEDRINREQAPIILIQPYVLGMEDNDKKGKTLKSASIADAIISTLAPNENTRSSMEAKSRQLHRILKDSRRAGFNHCLIIEEAHALSTPTLKHLKRFFELEDGFKKLISIVLIGQSELKIRLSEKSPEVREVVQRCEVVELRPLDNHIAEYLQFKFGRAGIDPELLLDKDAVDGIRARLIFAKASKTNHETISLMYPLMINNLITASLNLAATLGLPKISADLIKEA